MSVSYNATKCKLTKKQTPMNGKKDNFTQKQWSKKEIHCKGSNTFCVCNHWWRQES